MMLDNSFSRQEHIGIAPKVECPLCLDDKTTTDVAREKLWRSSGLLRHMRSVHSGSKNFARQTEMRRNVHVNGKYAYPYWEAISTGPVAEYRSLRDLIRHIGYSNSSRMTTTRGVGLGWMEESALATAHDNLKVEAGWYKPDGEGEPEVKAKDIQAEITQSVARAGIR